MFLARDLIDLGVPEPVVLAEPTVLKALWVAESVLLPEQGQGDTGAAQLGVSPCPVRHWALLAGNRRRWREQRSFQFNVRQCRGPSQPVGSKAIEVITDSGSLDLQADRNLAGR